VSRLVLLLAALLPGLAAAGALEARVMAALADRLPGALPGDSVAVDWGRLPLEDLPADCELSVEDLSDRRRGTSVYRVRFQRGDRTLRTLTLPVRQRIYSRRPVAARDLERGLVLGAGDLRLEWVESTRQAAGDLPTLEQVLGKRLERYLGEGRPVHGRMIRELPVVQRGERLTLTVVSGGISIHAEARALADGYPGEELPVRLVETGRRLEATLQEDGRAVVEVQG
jgi:flagella basal body P-ring formation protein FlgA